MNQIGFMIFIIALHLSPPVLLMASVVCISAPFMHSLCCAMRSDCPMSQLPWSAIRSIAALGPSSKDAYQITTRTSVFMFKSIS